MLRTSFCAVPAESRVEPRRTSSPIAGSIDEARPPRGRGSGGAGDRVGGRADSRASRRTPRHHGVRPLAVTAITASCRRTAARARPRARRRPRRPRRPRSPRQRAAGRRRCGPGRARAGRRTSAGTRRRRGRRGGRSFRRRTRGAGRRARRIAAMLVDAARDLREHLADGGDARALGVVHELEDLGSSGGGRGPASVGHAVMMPRPVRPSALHKDEGRAARRCGTRPRPAIASGRPGHVPGLVDDVRHRVGRARVVCTERAWTENPAGSAPAGAVNA